MHVEEIHIQGFGHLQGTRLTLKEGLVGVLGDNEAGKSTMLAAVRGILFGFTQVLTKEQRDHMGVDGRSAAAYDPVLGGSKGGSLVLVVAEEGTARRYRFTRTEVRKKDGNLTIVDLARNKEHTGEDAERLRQRLIGVDATVFGTVFGIGLDELHAIKALDKDAVQGVLFAADAGLGAEIVSEMDELGKALASQWAARAKNPRINTLNREIKDLDKEIRQTRDEVAAHRGEQEAYDRLDQEIRDLEERRSALLAEAAKAEKRQDARAVLQRLEARRAELAGFDGQVLPTADDRDAHVALKSAVQNARVARDEASDLHEDLRVQRAALDYDEVDAAAATALPVVDLQDLERLAAAAVRHETLRARREAHQGPYIPPAEREQLARLDARIDDLERRAERAAEEANEADQRLAEAREGALDEDLERRVRPLLNEDPAALERERQRLAEGVKRSATATEQALATLGTGWDRKRLAAAPADHATEARLLAALATGGAAGTARTRSWPTVAVGLALLGLGLIGLFGILIGPLAGGVLLLAGLAVAGIGLAGGQGAVEEVAAPRQAEQALAPYGLPATTTRDAFRGFIGDLRNAQRRLEDELQERHALQNAERRLAAHQHALVDALNALRLPNNGPTVVLQDRLRARLDAAQESRTQVRAAVALLEDRKRQLAEARAGCTGAAKERNALLARFGLPPDASRADAGGAVEQSATRDAIDREMEALSSDVQIYGRIAQGLAAVQEQRGAPAPTVDTFAETFRSVSARCAEAAEAARAAKRLDESVAKAEHEMARREARLRSASEELRAFYGRFGCTDSEGFQAMVQAAERHDEALHRMRVEEERLADLEANYPDLRADLARVSAEEDTELLAGRSERLQDLVDAAEGRRKAAQEIYAKLARVRDQDALTRLLQDRAALEEELKEAQRDWLRLGLTKKLLEKVREKYEREHGPQVLQEAGRLLARITDGRYETIGREPDGSYVLTQADGRKVPALPPHLSRATFAQVYLSIRLAYAEVHDGQGVPYLLDDVLSDFDDGRLERAIDVLADLAKRRQVVLFTHHRHVADAMTDRGIAVTPLAGVATSPTVPTRHS